MTLDAIDTEYVTHGSMSTLITKLFGKNRIITISPLVSDCTIGRNFCFSYTIQYNSIQYNIVYFQHRTQLHHNSNFYPILGWLERGWTEE